MGIEGAHHQLITLQQMTDVINTKQLEDVFKNVEASTRFLVDASAANERSSASLEIMQVILAGSFAFDILDRISGGTLNIVVPKWVEEDLILTIIDVPFLFWFLNMVWFLLVSVLLLKLMARLGASALGALSLRVKINRKVDIKKLRAYLESKAIDVTDTVSEGDDKIIKMVWTENDPVMWQGDPPTIEVLYDDTYHFLLSAFFKIDAKRNKLREAGLMAVFNEALKAGGVYGEYSSKEDSHSKRMSIIEHDPDAMHKAAEEAEKEGAEASN